MIYRLLQLKITRLILCSIRIPLIYLKERGHIKKRNGLSVDSKGSFIPWITYPAMDFLNSLDFSQCSVFEFGSGSSTLWWSSKARDVSSVEMDEAWFNKMKRIKSDNVEIEHCPDGGLYPDTVLKSGRGFDVIVIDGAERFRSTVNAAKTISPDGLIILDNSDWYQNSAKFLREEGFTQIDFTGFSHNNSFPSRHFNIL